EVRAAYRRAVVAAGDVLLFRGKRDEARDFYAATEKLGAYIPPQVRAARVGAYPNALREYLAAGNYGAALDLVDRWDETFPADKLGGRPLLGGGRALWLRHQRRAAGRSGALALRRARGADFETEPRGLRPQARERLGRRDEARRELARLIKTGIDDGFTRQA